MRPFVIVFALLAFVAVSALANSESAPFLFVSKSVSDEYVVVGNSVEFTVNVYNYGQTPAVNVTITDILVDGTVRTKRFSSLSFGEVAELKYSVTPKELGNYAVGIAEVTYQLYAGETATHKSFSNVIREGTAYYYGDEHDDESFRGVVSVVTRERYDRLRRRYIREFVAYAFLCVIPALFPFVIYRTKHSQVDLLVRRSKVTK